LSFFSSFFSEGFSLLSEKLFRREQIGEDGRFFLFDGEGRRRHRHKGCLVLNLLPNLEEPVQGSVSGRETLNSLAKLFPDLLPQLAEVPRWNLVRGKLQAGASCVREPARNNKDNRKPILGVVSLEDLIKGIPQLGGVVSGRESPVEQQG
jgi:hypothetical protein